jgi:plasmid stabilization system protein ParE
LKTLEITGPAEVEFQEATRWYSDRDPRVAARFIAEARKTLQLIETFPRTGSRLPGVDDLSVRGMPIHKFPYYIVFVDIDDRVEVVAFAHKRRRPGYFMDRLRR